MKMTDTVGYPEYKWRPWLFTKASNLWFKSTATNSNEIYEDLETMENLTAYLLFVEERLGIVSVEDWHRVSLNQIQNVTGGAGEFHNLSGYLHSPAVAGLGGLASILPKFYPTHKWDIDLLKSSRKKSSMPSYFRLFDICRSALAL